ncbi:MAG: hypothetical protein HKN17_04095, partial [Rhodothermales bacterium]|nr:hypothetical protein [Rhodothermales bacterium]
MARNSFHPDIRFVRSILLIMLAAVLAAGCTPKISPLYRDYEIAAGEDAADEVVLHRIEAGLQAAGWSLTDPVTDNIVAT